MKTGNELLENYETAAREIEGGYEAALLAFDRFVVANDAISAHNAHHPGDRVQVGDFVFVSMSKIRTRLQMTAAKHHEAADRFAKSLGYR